MLAALLGPSPAPVDSIVQSQLTLRVTCGLDPDLRPEGQQPFLDFYEEVIKRIAGFAVVMEDHNNRYDRDVNGGKFDEKKRGWRELQAKDQVAFEEMGSIYKDCLKYLDHRRNVLRTEILHAHVETALLQEFMVGHGTAWEINFGSWKRSVAYYGAPYRLSEAASLLATQVSALKIDDKGPGGVVAPVYGAPESTEFKIHELSGRISFLKEEAAIVDEAMRRVAFESAKDSSWPKSFHIKLQSEWESCRDKMYAIGKHPYYLKDPKVYNGKYYLPKWQSFCDSHSSAWKILEKFKETFDLHNKMGVSATMSEAQEAVSTFHKKVIRHHDDVVHKPWELTKGNAITDVVLYYLRQNKALLEEMKTLQKDVVTPRLEKLQNEREGFELQLSDVQMSLGLVQRKFRELKALMDRRTHFWRHLNAS